MDFWVVCKSCLGSDEKRIVTNRIILDFILNAKLQQRPRTLSTQRLPAGLESLEAEGAGQGQHDPQPNTCLDWALLLNQVRRGLTPEDSEKEQF